MQWVHGSSPGPRQGAGLSSRFVVKRPTRLSPGLSSIDERFSEIELGDDGRMGSQRGGRGQQGDGGRGRGRGRSGGPRGAQAWMSPEELQAYRVGAWEVKWLQNLSSSSWRGRLHYIRYVTFCL